LDWPLLFLKFACILKTIIYILFLKELGPSKLAGVKHAN
jgi:hypothetical protein